MGMTSAYWRTAENLAATLLAYMRLGESTVRHPVRRSTKFSVQVRRKQQPGKGDTELARQSKSVCKIYRLTYFLKNGLCPCDSNWRVNARQLTSSLRKHQQIVPSTLT